MAKRSKGTMTRMKPDPRRVFVVYGRNRSIYVAMTQFLQRLKLNPVSFDEIRNELGGSPTILEIVQAGMKKAQAVVVLLTPDECGRLRSEYQLAGETAEDTRWQPRPNVFIESGMALALDRNRTLLVTVGGVTLPSDLAGLHTIPLDNSASKRESLRNALIGVKCNVTGTAEGIHDVALAGNFEVDTPATPSSVGTVSDPSSRLASTRLVSDECYTRTERIENSFRLLEKWDSSELQSARSVTRAVRSKRAELGDKQLLELVDGPLGEGPKTEEQHRLTTAVIALFNFFEFLAISLRFQRIEESIVKESLSGAFFGIYDRFLPWLRHHKDEDHQYATLEKLYHSWKS
ncbi:MAG: nucleotide-binding protein [Pirellulales bacterium]